jgi:hypothetical protein
MTTQLRSAGVTPAVVDASDPVVVRLYGGDQDVTILATDWGRILPYLEDGSFEPSLYPLGGAYRTGSTASPTGLDPLYVRILGVLQMLFPDAYPTSNL